MQIFSYSGKPVQIVQKLNCRVRKISIHCTCRQTVNSLIQKPRSKNTALKWIKYCLMLMNRLLDVVSSSKPVQIFIKYLTWKICWCMGEGISVDAKERWHIFGLHWCLKMLLVKIMKMPSSDFVQQKRRKLFTFCLKLCETFPGKLLQVYYKLFNETGAIEWIDTDEETSVVYHYTDFKIGNMVLLKLMIIIKLIQLTDKPIRGQMQRNFITDQELRKFSITS